MASIRFLAVAICALASSACLSNAGADSSPGAVAVTSSALSTDTKPMHGYYSVRRDVRRCASPLCGGYFVSTLNQRETTCADGSQAAECYVAELALPEAVSWQDGELIHGEIRAVDYPELDVTLGLMTADAVLQPAIEPAEGRGRYFLAYDTGIRCITTPCPSLAVVTLDRTGRELNAAIAFDAADDEAQAELQDAFSEELDSPSTLGSGAVVFGSLRFDFDGRSRQPALTLLVTNVYSTKRSRDLRVESSQASEQN